MEPQPATYIETSMRHLTEAIEQAAAAAGLSPTIGGLRGAETEWIWLADAAEPWVREVTVSAIPRADQLEVTVRSMIWRSDARDEAQRRLYFGRSYAMADTDAGAFAADLSGPLATAWREVSATESV